MVVFGQSCCIRTNVVVVGQSSFIWKKGVVFRQRHCIRIKMVVLGQKWLHSGK